MGLDEEIAATKARIAKLEEEIRFAQVRVNSKHRRAETRKKILWGSRAYETFKNGTMPQDVFDWLLMGMTVEDQVFLTGATPEEVNAYWKRILDDLGV
jgi:hypothetical protein